MKKVGFKILLAVMVFAVLLTMLGSCSQQSQPVVVGSNGANGKSAYELAVENGYTGTLEEWLDSLVGETGAAGQAGTNGESAYEIAVKNGYTGTEAEWLASLSGAMGSNGNNGANGTNGKSAYELAVDKGYIGTLDEWLDSLVGEAGAAGQAGTNGESAYEIAVKNGYTGTEAEWLASLIGTSGSNGINGKSAYELACENGFVGSLDEWLESLVGKNGKSAYDLAVENGFSGTLEEWIDSLKSTEENSGNTVSNQSLKVTVGAGADYATINEALEYLSNYYPAYKHGGLEFTIEIQAGTIINEQIKVDKIDLSYITIKTNDSKNTVMVDVTGWTGVTHDTRGNRPFFSAENGGRLPAIGCLFSCITPEEGWNDNNFAVGYFCNRGSSGVILGTTGANIGFEGFYDNVIANNNSEIVLREAICRNAARYGIVSRHISRVSARSADVTNCGDIAAYADRASMMDVRHADLSGSGRAIVAYHASTVTANETTANNMRGYWTVDARQGSVINCQGFKINGANSVFTVEEGGTIIANSAVTENIKNTIFSVTPNTVSADGIIYH